MMCSPAQLRRRLRRALPWLGGIILLSTLVVVPQAKATPNGEGLVELEARAAAVRSQIARLDSQASAAVEEYNQARAELDACSARLIEARRALARNADRLEGAEDSLGDHLAGMYKSEQLGLLEVLMSLGDFTDLSTHLEYMRLIHESDSAAVADLMTLTEQSESLAATIERERGLALEQEKALRDRQNEIEATLAQRESLLDDLDARIKRLVKRQAEREAAAARALAEQAGIDLDGLAATHVQRALVAETMKYLGIPYVWGGASPTQGFDCSGLVMYVYSKFGVSVLHGATLQARGGTPVPLGRLQPADLVFFGSPSFYHHVGIYIGDGLFIEAPHTGDVVKISKLAPRNCTFACRYPIRAR